MSYKEVTRKSYQETAEEFAHNVADLAPLESIERFIKFLPPKAKIIDIGCGSGRDAKRFTEKNVSVVGIDFCMNLLEIAKATAPLAHFQMMDIENISFPAASFEGAWAACSLLHVPKKNFPLVLERIRTILKKNGYFYLTLKKGSGEGLETDLRYGHYDKFWSFYEEDELKKILQTAKFNILDCCTVEKQFAYQTHSNLRIFCQKE
jgi:ubiquinone/menaquinone biosynthesis C-methylase UbiE